MRNRHKGRTPNPPLPSWSTALFEATSQPLRWRVVARRLRSAADILIEKESRIASQFWQNRHSTADIEVPEFEAWYLLIALSIENFLKGIILGKGFATISDNNFPKSLSHHRLDELHKSANPASIISVDLLEALSHMIYWRARYPIPTEPDDFWPPRQDGTPKATSINPHSHAEISTYADGLDSELTALLAEAGDLGPADTAHKR